MNDQLYVRCWQSTVKDRRIVIGYWLDCVSENCWCNYTHTDIYSIQAVELIISFIGVRKFNSSSVSDNEMNVTSCFFFPHNKVMLQIHEGLLTFLPTVCPECCSLVGEKSQGFSVWSRGIPRFITSYICFTESNFNLTQNITVYPNRKSHQQKKPSLI